MDDEVGLSGGLLSLRVPVPILILGFVPWPLGLPGFLTVIIKFPFLG